MNRPITWRDVQAPNFSGVSNIFNSAGNSIRQGLSAGSGIINQLEARQEEGTQLNTDQFLDTVRSRYSSPEAIAQAQASGELDQLRGQFSSLDRKRSGTGAIDGLVGELQTRAIRDQRFDDSQIELNTREAQNQFATNLAAGDFEANDQLLADIDFGSREQALIGQNASAEKTHAQHLRTRAREARVEADRVKNQSRADAKFERDEAERLETEAIEAQQGEYLSNLLDAKYQQTTDQTQLRDVAALNNITTDELANPGSLTDEQLDYISELQAANAEVSTAPSEDEVGKGFLRSLLNSGADVNKSLNAYNNFTSAAQLTERGNQAELAANNRQVQALASEYPSSSGVKDIVNKVIPVEAANEIMGSLPESLRENLGRHDLQTSRKHIAGLMSDGLLHDGKRYKVPKAWIENAVNLMDNSDFLWTDNKLTDVLSEFMSDPNSGMLSDIKQAQQFEERQAELVAKQNRNSLTAFNSALRNFDVDAERLDRARVPDITNETVPVRDIGGFDPNLTDPLGQQQLIDSLNGFGNGSSGVFNRRLQ